MLVEIIEKEMEVTGTDLVRTYLFGSYPDNYDDQDEPLVQRQLDFLTMLTEEFHFEVVKFPIDFCGRRVRRQDRNPSDTFEQQEKYVDVALATTMTYYITLPDVCDIAVAVVGDGDYEPLFR